MFHNSIYDSSWYPGSFRGRGYRPVIWNRVETNSGRACFWDFLRYTYLYFWYGNVATDWSSNRFVDRSVLAEVGNKKLVHIVQPAVELLAAVPSVIYGLLGIMILKPLMYNLELMIYKDAPDHQFTGGANFLSAILVLAIMILPTVINISASSIRAVQPSIKSASLALGATKIQTIFKVVLPAAKSGIMTAVVLGMGRALGEAMAIAMVAGGAVNLPLPFHSVRFLTTLIVGEMSYSSGLHREALFTIGLVLFVFILFVNIFLTRIVKKGETE